MVDKLIRLTSEQRSSFVAYLDGELDEQQSRQIENLLAQNEVARHDMESLAATWELLDEMPRVKASESFSQKTMETLQLENREFSLQEQPWFQQSKRIGTLLLGTVLVLVCGVLGFVAARSLPPSAEDVMIRNYALLKRLDQYQEIGSTEFLDRLQRSVEWSRRPANPRERDAR